MEGKIKAVIFRTTTQGPIQLAGPLHREIKSRGSLQERRWEYTRQAHLRTLACMGRRWRRPGLMATFCPIIQKEGGLSLGTTNL